MKKINLFLLIFIVSILFIPKTFAASKYTIKFNGNSSTSGNTSKVVCKIDKKCSLTKNSFKKEGYKFVGWNTKKNGTGITYNNKQKVKNLIKKGTITLYAIWVKNTYTIKFDGNGATSGSMENIKCKANKDCNLTKNTFKKDNYVFDSWNTKKDGSGITYKNKANVKNITTKSSIKLYAIYREKQYTIIFNNNGENVKGSVKKIVCKVNSKCKLTSNSFKYNGFSFVGWNTKMDGTGTSYKNKAKVKNLTKKDKEVVNLYAMWVLKNPELIINKVNDYYRSYDFDSVQRTNDYIPHNKSELLNVIYSILNNGWDDFTFYCPNDYLNCISDFISLKDDELYKNLNSFVSPFNSFSVIESSYNKYGVLNIKVDKKYNYAQIKAINKLIDKIISDNITNSMGKKEKIKTIHDYIINNTTYNLNKSKYDIYSAYGVLKEKNAVCQGYTDAMALFLDRFNIKNYLLTSSDHAWNGVYIGQKWLHLDVTWDDPVSSKPMLLDDYFLINNKILNNVDEGDTTTHLFNKDIYKEFNY